MTHDPRMTWSEERLSRALRALPVPVPPPGLTTSLRVIASRERQRRVSARHLGAALSALHDRWELFTHNLMRPLALPIAGGVFSAVALFSMLVPTYPVRAGSTFDVPTVLTTQVAV